MNNKEANMPTVLRPVDISQYLTLHLGVYRLQPFLITSSQMHVYAVWTFQLET